MASATVASLRLFLTWIWLTLLFSYKWMTYGEAGTARTALGSGLVHHGIPLVNDLILTLLPAQSFS